MNASITPQRRLALFLALWLFQTFAYFVPSSTWSPVSRLGLTAAVATRGSFEIGELATATGDRAHRGDAYYSDKAPLPSLLAVPAYGALRLVHRVLGRSQPGFTAIEREGIAAADLRINGPFAQLLYVSSVGTAGLAGALVGLLLFELLRRRYSLQHALIAAALTVLGTPLFPYATSLYGHVPAAALLLGATLALDGDGGRRPWREVALGACLGAAVACEYILAVPALLFVAYGLARRSPRSRGARALGALVGALPPALLLALYHLVCFGAPWRTGYHFVENATFVAGHAQGFMGISPPSPAVLVELLVGPSRGLFYVAPLAAVGAAGLVGAWTSGRLDGPLRAATLALVTLLVLNAGYYMWWGGSATGPRHLVPLIWVLGVGVAHALEAWRGLAWAVPVGLLSALSMLAFTAVGMEAPPEREAVFGYALAHLAEGHVARLRGASNVGIMLGLAPAASLGPLLALWLLGGRALVREAREIASEPAAAGEPTEARRTLQGG